MNRSSGFSLVELLIAVAILGILFGIGIPALSGYRKTLAQEQARMQIIADLRSARQTSVTRHRSVVVVFGNGTVPTNVTDYSFFTDLNANGVKDNNEPGIYRKLPKAIRLSKVTLSPTNKLIFDSSGLLQAGSSGGRLILAGSRGKPDTLAVSAVGMVYDP